MRSKSGAGGTIKDPVLELMMSNLMQRQSTSNSGAVVSSSGTKHLPVSQIITHHAYSVGADLLGPSTCAQAGAAGVRGCCCRLWQKLWFKIIVAMVLLAALAVAIAVPVAMSRRAATRRGMLPPQYGLGPRLNTSGMTLVFADDFTQFDAGAWNYDVGDGQDYGLKR
jgi:hypothetical protein